MKPKNNALKNNNAFKFNLHLLCLPIIFIFIISCNPQPEPFKIVEFKGIEEVINYSKTAVTFKSDSVNPATILYSKGDIFQIGELAFITATEGLDNSCRIQFNDSILLVNGKIYGICIPDSGQMIPWFRNMGNKDLSDLQFLYFNSEVSDVYYPYLEEIAKIRPDISISIGQNLNEMSELLTMFQPKCLIISDMSVKDFELLAGLTDLEILWTGLNDSIINEPLPAMPKLNQVVFIMDQNDNRILTNDLFINNQQIEKVNFQIADIFDLAVLSPLKNLKELTIGFSDTIRNPDEINQHQTLEVLSMIGNAEVYDPSGFELPNIRWMTFYENVEQVEFDRFVVNHPTLEVLELISNEEITNFNELAHLKNLFGLTIAESEVELKAIENLKALRYLSLPTEFLDESANREAVEAALPGVKIAANNGYLCLGSGWLLLLIPLVIIFRILMLRKTFC